MTWGMVAVAGASVVGGMMSADAASSAAEKQGQRSEASAAALREASKWKAVGTTNRYGSSSQTVDPVTGALSNASWNMSPEMKAYQDRMMAGAGSAMPTNFNPEAATAAQYQLLKNQQAPGVERGYSGLLSNLVNKGTTGLATGGTEGIGGGPALRQANPQMEAFYNAVAQQDAANMTSAQTQARGMMDSDIARANGLFGQVNGIEDRGLSALDRTIRWGADQRDATLAGAGAETRQSNLASQQIADATSGSPMGSMLQGIGSNPRMAGAIGGFFGTSASPQGGGAAPTQAASAQPWTGGGFQW